MPYTNPFISTLFVAYIYVAVARCLFDISRVNICHPLASAVDKLTRWPIGLLRYVVPRIRRWDLSPWIYAYILNVLHVFIFYHGHGSVSTNSTATFSAAFLYLFMRITNFYIIAIFAMALLSWVVVSTQTSGRSIFHFLEQVTAPLLYPIRRVLPSVGAFDLSPAIAILVLFIIQRAIGPLA